MTDRENLTALLMAGAGACLGKGGALNCSKLADYLLEHGVIVLPLEKTVFLTREEAIKTIRVAIAEVEWDYPLDYAIAFETAIEALEKQIPKKPIPAEEQNARYAMKYTCPSCGKHFTGTGIADYCYHCGQALDWRETK